MDTTQLLKGVLDVAVLAVVDAEDGYGYDVVRRLRAGGLVDFVANPSDRRSKFVVPFDRDTDPDAIDPVTARVREFALGLPSDTADQIAAFLDRVREVVDAECA